MQQDETDTEPTLSHNVNPIVIDSRRWNPITGTASGTVATGADILKYGADIFYQPINETKRGLSEVSWPDISRSQHFPAIYAGSSGVADVVDPPGYPGHPRTSARMMGAALAASGKRVGKVVGYGYKGAIVDIPLATTEGLRAVPRLYGEDVKTLGPVRDWKSGIVVAGKGFLYGVAGGLTDIIVQPYKGAQDEGAIVAAKGVAKGTISTMTKLSSGMLGLVAYPGQGICKSIQAIG